MNVKKLAVIFVLCILAFIAVVIGVRSFSTSSVENVPPSTDGQPQALQPQPTGPIQQSPVQRPLTNQSTSEVLPATDEPRANPGKPITLQPAEPRAPLSREGESVRQQSSTPLGSTSAVESENSNEEKVRKSAGLQCATERSPRQAQLPPIDPTADQMQITKLMAENESIVKQLADIRGQMNVEREENLKKITLANSYLANVIAQLSALQVKHQALLEKTNPKTAKRALLVPEIVTP